VIEELEYRGYEIVSIAGTSMGALVGGLHAAGQLHRYCEWVTRLTQRQVPRLLDLPEDPGAIRAREVPRQGREAGRRRRHRESADFLHRGGTDLLAGREVWCQEGPLGAAIRASIALPTPITPVMINGRLLADGGMLNPIPTAPTAASHADVTVAVSLAGEPAHAAGQARAGKRAAAAGGSSGLIAAGAPQPDPKR
jgi:NTE family protein